MSTDNPASTDETDKPAPARAVLAETDDGADDYDPDPDDLADEALSEPPINYDEDPVPHSRHGAVDSQGSAPAASGTGHEQGGAGQDGTGVASAPAARDQGGSRVSAPEAGSLLEQAGNGPGTSTLDGGADVYDPDLDALADEALSEPPINYDEDPAPVRTIAADDGFGDGPTPGYWSQDGAAGLEAQEPAAEPAARQRPGREAQEQPAAPAPGREQAETKPGTETGDKQSQQTDNREEAAREIPPLPQQDYSDVSQHAPGDADPPPGATAAGMGVPEVRAPTAATGLPAGTENVTEAGNGQNTADAALIAAQADDIPVTPTVRSEGDLSGGSESLLAERTEDPAVSHITTEAVTQEPGTAEPDPDEHAQPEDPPAAGAAEPGPGDDNDPGETAVVSEAGTAQVSTAEHDPQTQGPEPEPETARPLAATEPRTGDAPQSPATGATSETASGSEASSGSGPKPPDGPGPGDGAEQQGESKNPVLHVTSEFHGRKLGMYTDLVHWKPEDVVQDALEKGAKDRQSKAPERHDITDFPQARDLGDNTVGEKPEESPGDTSDLPPAGEELVNMEDKDAPRSRRFGRKFLHEYSDVVDAAKNETDVIHDVLARPVPQGHADVGPPASSRPRLEQTPHAAPDPSAIVEASLITGLVLFRVGQAIEHRLHRERRSEDDSH